ncbi:hypothetical protein FRC11_012997, partial [Ceratobasidium sp. 423]
HSAQFKYIPKEHEPWRKSLCSLLSGAKGGASTKYTFRDDADSELSSVIGTILQTCHHNQVLKNEHDNPTETDRRITIDNLLSLVCEINRSECLKYSTGHRLKLYKTHFGPVHVSTTTPDGVIYLDVPEFRTYEAGSMDKAVSAFGPKAPKNLRVVHCVAEYKRDNTSGANQAILGIVSGIVQKRVLRRPEQFVFGIFQYETKFLQVVAAGYKGDKINLYDVGKYNLNYSLEVVQFYLVLMGIKKLSKTYLDTILKSDEPLGLEILENPPADEWVKEKEKDRMGSIAEHPDETNDQPNVVPGDVPRNLLKD